MQTIKVLEVTKLPFGCELRREIVRSPGFSVIGEFDDPEVQDLVRALNGAPTDLEWVAGYAPDGSYIGAEKDVRYLVEDLGIAPQLAHKGDKVCSIGWCEKDQKWYGWSHRAICGFGIDSIVRYGDCAYEAPNADAFGRSIMEFFCDSEWHENCNHRPSVDADGVQGVLVSATYNDRVPNEKLHSTVYSHFSPYPSKWGRGEWVAGDVNDAKEMAIAFANAVS
jgi:hypothetical protein